MDTIFIEGLIYWGKHGLTQKEKLHEQPFAIDVQLHVDTQVAGKSDKLHDTIDYSQVKDVIQRIIEGKRANLLEHLAFRICDELFSDTRISRVAITIRRFGGSNPPQASWGLRIYAQA